MKQRFVLTSDVKIINVFFFVLSKEYKIIRKIIFFFCQSSLYKVWVNWTIFYVLPKITSQLIEKFGIFNFYHPIKIKFYPLKFKRKLILMIARSVFLKTNAYIADRFSITA